jgi:hypothetical protein
LNEERDSRYKTQEARQLKNNEAGSKRKRQETSCERQETNFKFRKTDLGDRKSQSDSIHEVVFAPGETRWNEMILALGNPNPVRVELLGQKNRKCQIKAGRDRDTRIKNQETRRYGA